MLLRSLLGRGAWLLVWAPLAAGGIVAHLLPYQLTAALVRRIPHTDEEEATDKIAAGLVLYPLAWALEAWGLFALGGGRALALFLAALLPVGFFALAWRERLERLERDARAFARVRREPELPGRLHERRRALATEILALASLTPEVWAG